MKAMESPAGSAAESGAASPESDLLRLEAIVSGYGPTLTAYSGGVDSTVVAVVAARALGAAALAVTGVSASLSKVEGAAAVSLAGELGLEHRVVDTDELSSPEYRANSGDRCYHCKAELFDRLTDIARREGFSAVASGDNRDDLGDHRPGMRAGEERSVRRPLVEAGLGKERVRALARHLGLPNHDKPATPCLASRVPHGVSVDAGVLGRVERAEAVLRDLGFELFRVRHHDDVARVEVPEADMDRALARRKEIVSGLREAGYRWVTLDLAGFRSGGLNVVLVNGRATRP